MSSDTKELIRPIALNEATYNIRIDLWLENFRLNLERIRQEPQLQDLEHRKGEPCICVGAGPSLARNKHLQKIGQSGWKHPVLCCDKIFADALSNSVNPYLVASVDGSPLVRKFYKPSIVRKNIRNINVAFNVAVHPTVANMKKPAYWFTGMLDDVTHLQKHSVTYILCRLANHRGVISGVGNVGGFLWNEAVELECSPIILVGYDFSEQVKYKEQTVFWNGIVTEFLRQIMKEKGHEKPTKQDGIDAQDKASLIHQIEENPDFIAEYDEPPYFTKGKPVRYLVNPTWKGYREALRGLLIGLSQEQLKRKLPVTTTINCSGNGCLHTSSIQTPYFQAKPLEQILKEYNT